MNHFIIVLKRDFSKLHHQHGSNLIDSDQQVEFFFGENYNYHQVGISYLEYDITVQDPNAAFDNNSHIRLTNTRLAFVFQEAVLATTSGSILEHNKLVGEISTFMRASTNIDGVLLSEFDNNNEGNTNDDFDSTSRKKCSLIIIILLVRKLKKGRIKGQLPLEPIFGFCKTFRKVTKNIVFHITFKTANLQNIIYNSIADGTQINVTINSLYFYIPFLIPTTETQLMFNESIQNNYRILFDERYSERRIATDQIFQVDIGSFQAGSSPKLLICAHQQANRSDPSNKRKNISIFDDLGVRKYFVEIDGIRYPRDSVLTNYDLTNYRDQYKDVELFYKDYVGEELLNPFITYPHMKNNYPIQVIDLRFQVDPITPNKFNYLKNIEPIPLMEDCLL